MRLNRTSRHGTVVFGLGACAVVWSGCSGAKATEIVAGVQSQVQVPRDLETIVINVDTQLGNVFCQGYPVYDGKVRLPRTLGVVSDGGDPTAPVTITVAGYDAATISSTNDNLGAIQACQPPVVSKPTANSSADGSGARVLRRARETYVQDSIVYLPMPLHYSCYDVDCSTSNVQPCASDNSCTCLGGVCTNPTTVSSADLPIYNDNLVFGTSDTCFRPFSDQTSSGTLPGCMDEGIPPQIVDQANCIYVIPGTASAATVPSLGPYSSTSIVFPQGTAGDALPGVSEQEIDQLSAGKSGLNVRLVYQNVVSEVLDYEGPCPGANTNLPGPVEGYCTFPNAPQMFQLAPGLCQDVTQANALHPVTLMTVDATCAPKTAYQPVCDDSVQGPPQPTLPDGGTSPDGGCNVATALTPAPSALYMLFDKSSGMRDFFGAAGAQQALSVSLSDPVFRQTLVSFRYTPGPQSDCTAAPPANSFANPTSSNDNLWWAPSQSAQVTIGDSLAAISGPDGGPPDDLPAGSTPWFLEAALDGAYTGLATESVSTKEVFNRLAVMLFLDRDFANGATDDCDTASEAGGSHPDAITEAQNAYAAQGISTYIVMLKNADDTADGGGGVPPQQAINDAAELAQPRDQSNGTSSSNFFDATGSNFAGVELQALTKVVADLGSCVYEPVGNIGTSATLSFLDYLPSGGVPTTVSATYSPAPAGCAGDSAATPLWVYDNQHISLCPTTCATLVASQQTYQEGIITLNLQNAQAGLPAVPSTGVPVTALEPCTGTADPPIKEAGVPQQTFDAASSSSGGDAASAPGSDAQAAAEDSGVAADGGP